MIEAGEPGAGVIMRIVVNAALKCVLATLPMILAAMPVNARAADEADSAVQASKPKVDWAAKVSQTTVAEGEIITLVVHSARDCKYCVRWMGPFAGEGHFKSWARSHPGSRLFIVERDAIASNEAPEDYPPDLRWLSERYQKDQRVHPATPMFEVFVTRNLVMRSYGLYSWDDKVFPAIKDLDARRSHAGASAE